MSFDPNKPRSRDEVLLQAIVSGDSSAMGDPRDREEEFVKAIADKETLPDYSEASNGDVLQIGADGPKWGDIPSPTLYRNMINGKTSENHITAEIITSTQFSSISAMASYLKNKGFSNNAKLYPASGYISESGTNFIVLGIFSSNGSNVFAYTVDPSNFNISVGTMIPWTDVNITSHEI